MSSSDEREIIFAHALKDQEHLKTTLEISFAFPELRKRIIHDFLDSLEEFVLDMLGHPNESEWRFIIDEYHHDLRKSPLEKYRRFGFGKTSWRRQYGVALEPHKDSACDVRIGVWREYNQTTKMGAPRFQPNGLLREELNNKIRNGGDTLNDWWEWSHFLDAPYRNWDTKEALIKLYNGEAVRYIGDELVSIIKVAEQFIDEHVKQNSQ